MTTLASTLAWRILWTEDPGRLQSMDHKELNMTEVSEHSCMHTQDMSWVFLWTIYRQNVKLKEMCTKHYSPIALGE